MRSASGFYSGEINTEVREESRKTNASPPLQADPGRGMA